MSNAAPDVDFKNIEQRIEALLGEMTLSEKIGQMNLPHVEAHDLNDDLRESIRAGRVGAVLNLVDAEAVTEVQRIAVEESRLGIPLLFGRDVIHGFNTIMPIPLGQAATWNPDVVRDGARVAAAEASAAGVNWTFAPMIDLTRDPRWGRIAESLGEDAHLTSILGAAMVRGFQGDDPAANGSIAATAKHFAGYGAVESGRDYMLADISEHELRNYYLRPFKSALDAGVSTFMASYSDLNGVPATASEFLMRDILRAEWGFDGFVVSDWDSVRLLATHGLTENDRASVLEAVTAGVDMEMFGRAYANHIPALIEQGEIDEALLDPMVANILRTKFKLGLFESPYPAKPTISKQQALETARKAALQSLVLLKNDDATLPLAASQLKSLAVIGPLADAPYEQMGTWVFDGDKERSVTPLQALRQMLDDKVDIRFVPAMKNSRGKASARFDKAVDAVRTTDAAVLFLGEESILSGEAHSRADINLPGDQAELVRRVRAAGKPVVAVILAGRPLTLTNIVDQVDAIIYAWHPGSMGGPAIADVLLGTEAPSGKLPVTFPRMVGQVPIYYNQKNTGKPPTDEMFVHIDDIEEEASQTSFGMAAFHLDAGYKPLFAFGHGLTYTTLTYSSIKVDKPEIRIGETVRISAELVNTGDRIGEEIVQLYVRDLVGSVTRPIKELKGFKRVRIEPDQTATVEFELHTDELAFFDRKHKLVTEPGEFHVWIGGNSETQLRSAFRVVE